MWNGIVPTSKQQVLVELWFIFIMLTVNDATDKSRKLFATFTWKLTDRTRQRMCPGGKEVFNKAD